MADRAFLLEVGSLRSAVVEARSSQFTQARRSALALQLFVCSLFIEIGREKASLAARKNSLRRASDPETCRYRDTIWTIVNASCYKA